MLNVVVPVIVIWLGWWYLVVQWSFKMSPPLRSICFQSVLGEPADVHPGKN